MKERIEEKIEKYLSEGKVTPIPEVDIGELFFDYYSKDPRYAELSSREMDKVEGQLQKIVAPIIEDAINKANNEDLDWGDLEKYVKKRVGQFLRQKQRSQVGKDLVKILKDKSNTFWKEQFIEKITDVVPM